MFRTNPIEALGVDYITARTIVLTVQSRAPLHLLWPYVRANVHVPDEIRAISTVFPRKSESTDPVIVRQEIIADVGWRWDAGYVCAAKVSGGWMFGWSSGEKD